MKHEYSEYIRIPENRKGVLIGKNGNVKRALEKKTQTQILIGEDVEIRGSGEGLYKAVEVVKAVGRGFSPHKAFNLLKEDWELIMISLRGETDNTIKRLMGRIIGKKGLARERIERNTKCFISVYGKTVSVIGPFDRIHRATDAVESLLSGRKHGFVWKKLEEE